MKILNSLQLCCVALLFSASTSFAQSPFTSFSTTLEAQVSGNVAEYPILEAHGAFSNAITTKGIYTTTRIPGHIDIESGFWNIIDPSIPNLGAKLFKIGEQLFGLVSESRCPSGLALRSQALEVVIEGDTIPVGLTLQCYNAIVGGVQQYPSTNIHFFIRLEGSPYSSHTAPLNAIGFQTGELVVGLPLSGS